MRKVDHVSPLSHPVVKTIIVDGRTINIRAQGGDYEACVRSYAASLQPSARKVKRPLVDENKSHVAARADRNERR